MLPGIDTDSWINLEICCPILGAFAVMAGFATQHQKRHHEGRANIDNLPLAPLLRDKCANIKPFTR